MKLMTKELREKLPPLYAQEEKGNEAIVYAHYFSVIGQGDWFITEYEPETGTMFGFCDLGFPELGYVSLNELEELNKNEILPPIERDRFWEPRTLKEVKEVYNY